MGRDPANLIFHQRVEAALTAACKAAGWSYAYETSSWGTGERHDLVRAELREHAVSAHSLALIRVHREREPQPHLLLQFEAAAAGNRGETEAIVSWFATGLATRRPELGGPHKWTVHPVGVGDPELLARRLVELRTFFSGVTWRWPGVQLSDRLEIAHGWDAGQLKVTVVRDELADADEDAAAASLAGELASANPELAAMVIIVGAYCK